MAEHPDVQRDNETNTISLDGLERFEQLETLTLYAFPRITSLAG
jgi:hypothetical protein